MQSWKVLFDRKDLKKAGQLDAVKLLPRLVSKGLGSGDVATDVEEDVVDEPINVAATVVLLATLLLLLVVECSARLIRRAGGSGGGLRSKRRTLSSDDATTGRSIDIDIAAATQGLHQSNEQSRARRNDCRRMDFDALAMGWRRRRGCGFTAGDTASAAVSIIR